MVLPKYFKLKLLVFLIGLFISEVSLCQCTSTILNPMTNVEASTFNETVIISTTSNAGEYFIIEKLSLGDAIVGASGDDVGANNEQGSAYIYITCHQDNEFIKDNKSKINYFLERLE